MNEREKGAQKEETMNTVQIILLVIIAMIGIGALTLGIIALRTNRNIVTYIVQTVQAIFGLSPRGDWRDYSSLAAVNAAFGRGDCPPKKGDDSDDGESDEPTKGKADEPKKADDDAKKSDPPKGEDEKKGTTRSGRYPHLDNVRNDVDRANTDYNRALTYAETMSAMAAKFEEAMKG
jgi:hypothetical protein